MKTLPGPPICDVSLREMLEAMSSYKDDETFRWYQTSTPSSTGMGAVSGPTLRVTLRQARLEVLR